LIEEVIGRIQGVLEVKVLFSSDLLRLKYLPHQVSHEEIQDRISKLGYRLSAFQDPSSVPKEKKSLELRLGISAILTVHVMMISLGIYAGFFQDLGTEAISILSSLLWILVTPVLFYGGWPIFRKAWAGLRYGKPSMEVLIAIAALSAYLYSVVRMGQGSLHLYFDTAAMLIVLVLLGKYLETRARERISRGILELYQLAHQKVRLLTKRGEKWLAADAVRPGDAFQVLPGERLSVDGRVMQGQANVDESYLTGESQPIRKGPNDAVRGGSYLLDGRLDIRATRVGAESSIGRIISLMQEGLIRKTAVELMADRLTRRIVPAILIIAAATALYLVYQGASIGEGLLRAVTVLVISCPCALGIATPLAKVASIGVGRTKGILVRDPAALEKIGRLDVLIFDKTGTLTEGRYCLRDIVSVGTPREEALQKIASLESLSDHFLAGEIRNKAREWSLSLREVKDFKTLDGLGVMGTVGKQELLVGNRRLMEFREMEFPVGLEPRAESLEARGNTIVFFGWEGRVRGFLTFGDLLKEGAREALAGLQEKGYQTWMVSGDSAETTGAIARILGIRTFIGQALPADKVGIIKELQHKGHRVGMIGDGLNDAAALAQADVGIALGAGAGVLPQSSDITLLSDDPLKIREVMDLSSLSLRIIRQNLLFAFFYNILAIPLAVSGILNPLLAALAMVASSLTVVGNTMRIYRDAADKRRETPSIDPAVQPAGREGPGLAVVLPTIRAVKCLNPGTGIQSGRLR
jgi:Cu2+-exporting ATPase/Cu+-exporting ATPase